MPIRPQKQSPSGPKPKKVEPTVDPWGSVTDTMKVLLYGDSGTGKTTFWATFPGPILCLICSGGKRPGELRSIATPEYKKKITPVMIESSDQLREELEKADKYETVVLDHGTGLADLVLKEILDLEEIPQQKSWGMATQQDYAQLGVKCKTLFKALLDVPGNTVIVAQERTFGGEEGGGYSEVLRPTVAAAFTKSVVGWLNPACDFVLQTFKRPKMKETVIEVAGQKIKGKERDKGVEYCLRCEPHDVFFTKFRIPLGQKLPDVIVNPTYPKLQKVIQGE